MGRLMFVAVVVLMLAGVALSFSAKVNSKKNVDSNYKEMLWKRLLSTLHEMDKQPAKQQNDVKARQYSGNWGYSGSGSHGSGSYGSGSYGSGSYGSGSHGSGSYGSGSHGSGSYGSGTASGMGSGHHGTGHDTSYPEMHGDEHCMNRWDTLDFLIRIFSEVLEKATWELYEDQMCHENIDLDEAYKSNEADNMNDVFYKMESSFRELTTTVNMCSYENVFSQDEVDGLVDLADWAYRAGGHEYGILEELDVNYNEGKNRAEGYAHIWSEDCRQHIAALDCNMEHLHKAMMHLIEKK